jgi:uncharacterized protein
MFVKKKVLLSLVIFLCIILSITSPVSAVEIPQLRSYITDEVGAITYSEYYQATYGVCEILDEETSSEIAILVINSTEEMEISLYAIEVFNSNGIGNREKDNGVLIVVATGDQTYFIAVGRGIEHILNDAKVGKFARDYFVPHAEMGDYGYGIYALTVMIASEIAENYEKAEPHRYPIDWIPLEWPQLILAFLILVGIMVITKGKVFIWIGGYLRKFSGGKTGGGGAGGKYR